MVYVRTAHNRIVCANRLFGGLRIQPGTLYAISPKVDFKIMD